MGMRLPKVMKYYWMATWMVITPGVLVFVLIMTFVQYEPAKSSRLGTEPYTHPAGIQTLGWLMAFLPIVMIPVVAFLQVRKRREAGQPTDRAAMFRPVEKWGPAVQTSNAAAAKDFNPAYLNEGFKYTVESNHL